MMSYSLRCVCLLFCSFLDPIASDFLMSHDSGLLVQHRATSCNMHGWAAKKKTSGAAPWIPAAALLPIDWRNPCRNPQGAKGLHRCSHTSENYHPEFQLSSIHTCTPITYTHTDKWTAITYISCLHSITYFKYLRCTQSQQNLHMLHTLGLSAGLGFFPFLSGFLSR